MVDKVVDSADLATPDASVREQLKRLQITRKFSVLSYYVYILCNLFISHLLCLCGH